MNLNINEVLPRPEAKPQNQNYNHKNGVFFDLSHYTGILKNLKYSPLKPNKKTEIIGMRFLRPVKNNESTSVKITTFLGIGEIPQMFHVSTKKLICGGGNAWTF